jgi:hypothetical protein
MRTYSWLRSDVQTEADPFPWRRLILTLNKGRFNTRDAARSLELNTTPFLTILTLSKETSILSGLMGTPA